MRSSSNSRSGIISWFIRQKTTSSNISETHFSQTSLELTRKTLNSSCPVHVVHVDQVQMGACDEASTKSKGTEGSWCDSRSSNPRGCRKILKWLMTSTHYLPKG